LNGRILKRLRNIRAANEGRWGLKEILGKSLEYCFPDPQLCTTKGLSGWKKTTVLCSGRDLQGGFRLKTARQS
jgi:hypothetical protein